MGPVLLVAESLHLESDRPGSLVFCGSEEAVLFTREVAESFAGVLRKISLHGRRSIATFGRFPWYSPAELGRIRG